MYRAHLGARGRDRQRAALCTLEGLQCLRARSRTETITPSLRQGAGVSSPRCASRLVHGSPRNTSPGQLPADQHSGVHQASPHSCHLSRCRALASAAPALRPSVAHEPVLAHDWPTAARLQRFAFPSRPQSAFRGLNYGPRRTGCSSLAGAALAPRHAAPCAFRQTLRTVRSRVASAGPRPHRKVTPIPEPQGISESSPLYASRRATGAPTRR